MYHQKPAAKREPLRQKGELSSSVYALMSQVGRIRPPNESYVVVVGNPDECLYYLGHSLVHLNFQLPVLSPVPLPQESGYACSAGELVAETARKTPAAIRNKFLIINQDGAFYAIGSFYDSSADEIMKRCNEMKDDGLDVIVLNRSLQWLHRMEHKGHSRRRVSDAEFVEIMRPVA